MWVTETEWEVLGRCRSPPPGRRVVAEDLERVEPDLVGSVDRPDHRRSERQVGADPSAIRVHGGHRTVWRHARARSDRWVPPRVRSVAIACYVPLVDRLAYDDKPILNAGPIINWLQRMGELPYEHQTPDGYAMVAPAWSASV